jgi:3-hydroxyisobutyrate dehydrogenase-like beta-hydroxyacid dehydrogenase
MQRITVAGLGIIGSAWAQNLQADGLSVRGWNRSPKDFPFFEADLAKAVADAEMIMIVVADPPAVESVLDVIVPLLKPGQLFAQRVEATGAAFLEAPFTGSKPAAEARKTVFYLGGSAELIERARPVLERISATRLHVGEIGSASSLKLAMNLNLALMMEALSESLTLARAEGISDEKFFDALHMNVGRSGLSDLKEAKLKAKDYAPQFSLKHMDKDLRLALETAGSLDLPTATTLKSFYSSAIEEGMGEDDFGGVIRALTNSVKNKK